MHLEVTSNNGCFTAIMPRLVVNQVGDTVALRNAVGIITEDWLQCLFQFGFS